MAPGTILGHEGALISQLTGTSDAIEAYERFDRREEGWLKVELDPAAAA